MSGEYAKVSATVMKKLKEGMVIPAHPLAVSKDGLIDKKCQRGLTRYYIDAGAGGLAIGVHTTEFKIHESGMAAGSDRARIIAVTTDL